MGYVQTGWRLLLPVVLVGVIGCSGGEPTANEHTRSPAMTLETAEAKIGPDAVMLMKRNDFRKTYDKLGQKQFDRANALTHWAAVAAAENPACDSVKLVGISEKSTREAVQWYADCSNGERLQITQAEADSREAQHGGASASKKGL